MTNPEPEAKQVGRRRWGIFRFDMLLAVFLLIGWSLIFTTATLGLQDSQEQWLSVGLISQISGDYTVKAADAPRLARIKPGVIEAVKRDQILLATPTPLALAATATLTNEQTITPTILGTSWQVSSGGPYKGQEGSEIPVSAELTGSMLSWLSDEVGYVSYVWDLDNDGQYDDANTASTSVVFYDEGEYTVGVQATDLLGQVGTAVTTVSVSNMPPLAKMGREDIQTEEGQEVALGATVSDPGHDVLLYTWDFGDSSPTVIDSLTPRYTYLDNGDYTVRLIVWDNDGGETEATTVVKVDNLPPEVDAGGDQQVNEGDKVTFAGTATDAGVSDTLTYAWDFNYDGLNFTPDADGPIASTTYPNGPANIVAALRVRDKDGGESLDIAKVTVINVPPTITAVSDDGPVGEGLPLALTVTATDAGKDRLTYAFDWNNNGSFNDNGDNNIASNIWYNQGTYTVRIRVDDGESGQAFTSRTISTFNQPPVAIANADSTALEGSSIAFDASDSNDPGRDDVLTYQWDFGDGASASGVSSAHAYSDNGVYSATLTVTDDSGAATVTGAGVTVLNANPVADAGADLTADEGADVSLAYNGTATDPGSGDTLSYAWDFDYQNNVFDEDATGASGTKVFPSLDGPAEYVIALQVHDDDYPFPISGGGEIGEALDTVKLTVNNLPPWNVNAGGPYSGIETAIINLTAAAEDVPSDFPMLEYAWDLDNNPDFETPGQQVIHVWRQAGVYTVRLRVRDKDGGEGFGSAQVDINNAPPNVTLTYSPITPTVILPVTFVANGSDPTNDPLAYHWNFGDGATVITTTATLTHTYPDDQVYTATVQVDDGRGGTDTDSAFVTIGNLPPVAVVSATPNPVAKGNPVTFDASGSSDPDDPSNVLSYAWNFGDGSPLASGLSVTHTYTIRGTHTATLTVSDDNGATGTATVVITVSNDRPTAVAGPDQTVVKGSTVNFDGSGSSDPNPGDVLTYAWDFGDGNNGSDVRPTHIYAVVGTYTVTLTVTDDSGESASDLVVITVTNTPPIAVAGATPNPVAEGSAIAFDGSGSRDPNGDPLSYQWNFGDGSPVAPGMSVTHIYPNGPANYTVTLTVTDSDGATSSATLLVTVINVPPTARAGATPNPVAEGSPITFGGSGSSDPGAADTLTYTWDFGDGNSASGVTVSHTYPNGPATYSVILTVTDSDGATDTATLTVDVNNVAPTAVATADQTSVNVGQTVNFDGTGSTDPGNDPLNYNWDFGDGTTDNSGPTVSHSWTSSGTYTIILQVDDGQAGVGTAQVQVTVN